MVLQIRSRNLLDVARCARGLTKLGETRDGGIVIGPVGWEQLRAALANLETKDASWEIYDDYEAHPSP